MRRFTGNPVCGTNPHHILWFLRSRTLHLAIFTKSYLDETLVWTPIVYVAASRAAPPGSWPGGLACPSGAHVGLRPRIRRGAVVLRGCRGHSLASGCSGLDSHSRAVRYSVTRYIALRKGCCRWSVQACPSSGAS